MKKAAFVFAIFFSVLILSGCSAPKKEDLVGVYNGITTCNNEEYPTVLEIFNHEDSDSKNLNGYLDISGLSTWDLGLLPSIGSIQLFDKADHSGSYKMFMKIKINKENLTSKFTFKEYDNPRLKEKIIFSVECTMEITKE